MTNNIAEALKSAYNAITEFQIKQQLTQQSRLIAVSKTKPACSVAAAYQAGQRAFGENYVQELVSKATELHQLDGIEWHFIGPIQSNKTKDIALYADWVHSVDRLKIAERLSAQRPLDKTPLQMLLQVNISGEESKSGIEPDELLQLADAVAKLPQLRLKGLMAIPEPGKGAEAFAQMQQLSQQLQQQHPDAKELSMGMSDDWQEALRFGSTMIRLGTAIFGARETNSDD
ncbi:MAG: YggS family pyridoxal phosphate-dependent enzyme [Gammaproteobacteria bacterium]|nr:YggS family pyridoxal phosphate-dependent enzyme [Gammaproteobacteria bacterium]MBU2056628.1 YggS family pyridoxal phosphate-dependent enzyme [Gammaproteobacteria bacterium]MBU2173965.1 YggS family pyridoxal phosphate-dependent enzyme [Gammaproteobacteria bacterium]MBU2247271.1 YggS family pyridoxal phosphate-dependent enzyme [Gammaproteobacteria bacterium]MBU2344929.1 YggS family pyridoxal phosphate-dependent enzyme [Gammaproteobacteria bacterium]